MVKVREVFRNVKHDGTFNFQVGGRDKNIENKSLHWGTEQERPYLKISVFKEE